MNLRSLRIGLVALVLVSCQRTGAQRGETKDPAPAAGAAAAGSAPAATAPPAAPASEGVSGRVVETMNSGGYTYALLDHGGTRVWVASMETKLAVGMELGRMDGTLMSGFHSDTLNRTFDQIYFVNTYAVPGGATAAPSPAAAAPAPTEGEDVSGTVVATMNSGGYTYAQLDRGGTKLWIAGPEGKLAVGAKLGRMSGSLMTNFRSDTLKRTFDQIYFVNTFATGESAPASATPGSPAPTTAAAPPNPHGAPPVTTEPIEKIEPVRGGTTVAQVFSTKATLSGKPVAVRGKVVKINNGIMGRNWIHLRDGTGAAGSNDLMVTTQATAKVGDVVVARGNLTVDKDFGAGYRYEVIVEDAAIAAQ